MTTLSAAMDNVYILTDRPDLTAETSLALTRALRACHYASEWYFDEAFFTITNQTSSSFTQSLPTRFRQVKTIYAANGVEIKPITSKAFYSQNYTGDKRNTYMIIGGQISFNLASGSVGLKGTYLQQPTFEDSDILLNHSDYLEFKAAEFICTIINDVAKAQKFQAMAQECFVELERQAFLE